MPTDTSVPVPTSLSTTLPISVPTTTTIIETPLTEEEKKELYNKYKSELTRLQKTATAGKVITMICGIIFALITFFVLMDYMSNSSKYERRTNWYLFYTYVVLMISFIIPLILCAVSLGLAKKVMSSEYKKNYITMYNKAANSEELINLYHQEVGKREITDSSQECKVCKNVLVDKNVCNVFGNCSIEKQYQNVCTTGPCENKDTFNISSSYNKIIASLVISIFGMIFCMFGMIFSY
jgi:hypothetical protein